MGQFKNTEQLIKLTFGCFADVRPVFAAAFCTPLSTIRIDVHAWFWLWHPCFPVGVVHNTVIDPHPLTWNKEACYFNDRNPHAWTQETLAPVSLVLSQSQASDASQNKYQRIFERSLNDTHLRAEGIFRIFKDSTKHLDKKYSVRCTIENIFANPNKDGSLS